MFKFIKENFWKILPHPVIKCTDGTTMHFRTEEDFEAYRAELRTQRELGMKKAMEDTHKYLEELPPETNRLEAAGGAIGTFFASVVENEIPVEVPAKKPRKRRSKKAGIKPVETN